MGLDYSYQLYFHHDKLWTVLQSLADFADSSSSHDQIDIIFPDGHKLKLPFSSSYGTTQEYRDWANRTQPIYFEHTAKSLQFNTSLYFEPDEDIEDYIQEMQDDIREQGGEYKDWVPSRDDQGRYSIGYIYLTVSIDLNEHGGNDYKSGLICFDFAAATTGMSLLFERSTSIRKTLLQLLDEHDGVCGLFDDETRSWLIWSGDNGKVYKMI